MREHVARHQLGHKVVKGVLRARHVLFVRATVGSQAVHHLQRPAVGLILLFGIGDVLPLGNAAQRLHERPVATERHDDTGFLEARVQPLEHSRQACVCAVQGGDELHQRLVGLLLQTDESRPFAGCGRHSTPICLRWGHAWRRGIKKRVHGLLTPPPSPPSSPPSSPRRRSNVASLLQIAHRLPKKRRKVVWGGGWWVQVARRAHRGRRV